MKTIFNTLPTGSVHLISIRRLFRRSLLGFAIIALLPTLALAAPPWSPLSLGTSAGGAQLPAIVNQFTPQQQLTAADGAALDHFGTVVAISGDTALVGAPNDTVGTNLNQGSVYVFVRSGTSWTQEAQLFASDGAAGDEFGFSVALDGNTAVIGADADDVFASTDQGTAYVFVRSGTTWTEQGHLYANDGSARDRDYFGNAVAVQGDTAIVGAFLNDSFHVNQGSAYVYLRSGTTWTLQQHLFASDGVAVAEFGSSVAVDSDTAVVGAWSDTVGANIQQGSGYVFVRSGTTWTQQAKLVAADGQAQDFFGVSIAISGETVVAGSDWHDVGANTNQGAAYVFVRSGTTWSQQQQLTASDGTMNDEFGHSVAVVGDSAIVGAWMDDVAAATDEGSAYVFTRFGSTWTQQQQLTAADGLAGDQFGTAVALNGTTFIAGASADDVGATADQGTASVFTQATAALHVAGINPRYKPQGSGNQVEAQVAIQDADGAAASGATVSIDVTAPNNHHRFVQAVTNGSGKARVTFKTSLHGSFTLCVTDVAKAGYTYDPSQNVETCDSVVVP